MSHYSVAVFTKQDVDVTYEDLLAPYDENLSVPHYIPKEDIIRRVRERIESYKNGLYAEYLKDPEKYISECHDKGHIEYITTVFPKQLEWTDEECYADGIKYDEEDAIQQDGSVFSCYNPDSKWDWYVVGGRFSGMVPLKSGGFVDEACMSDVDIDYVDEDVYKKSLRFWQLYVDGEAPVTEEDDELIRYVFYTKEYCTQRYKNAEEYAKDNASFSFYAALLPNGEWLEPGAMGWFGMSDASISDEILWKSKAKDILRKAQDENWYITIVDCHI